MIYNERYPYCKPCPFCGSRWTQVRYICDPFDVKRIHGGFRGECTDCGAQTRACRDPKTAAEFWNQREKPEKRKRATRQGKKRFAGKLRQMIFGIRSPSAIAAGALDPHEMKDAFLKGVCEQTRSEALEMYDVGKYAALGLQSVIKDGENDV